MTYQLNGRTAVITGGNRGIGRATAEKLARSGVRVVLGGRDIDSLDEVTNGIRRDGGTAVAVKIDVTEQSDTEELARTAVNEFGGIDVVIANAGRELSSTVMKSDPRDWIDTIDTNVTGTFLTVHAALPHMVETGGQILVIGSGMGHQKVYGRSAYSASKAGVSHLAGILALEVWRYGISVNEVVPGPTHTEMTNSRWKLGEVPAEIPSERVKPASDVADYVHSLLTLGPDGPTGQIFSLARRPL